MRCLSYVYALFCVFVGAVQTVLKEYGAMQMESEARVRELERSLEDKADKLRVYERMEGELDQLVLDAAAIDDPTLAERILANYGTTAGTSSTFHILVRAQVPTRMTRCNKLHVLDLSFSFNSYVARHSTRMYS